MHRVLEEQQVCAQVEARGAGLTDVIIRLRGLRYEHGLISWIFVGQEIVDEEEAREWLEHPQKVLGVDGLGGT